jgi:predicted membrane channel-forming protein YqfA (hemolysin III family)
MICMRLPLISSYLCKMLNEEEQRFYNEWKKSRLGEKSLFKQLSLGLPIGLLFGIAILLNFFTGWYKRANMVANSQSTPMVLFIAIAIIAIFCSVFYKRHRWEMNEQRFRELQYKMDKNEAAMQQEQPADSQSEVTKDQ